MTRDSLYYLAAAAELPLPEYNPSASNKRRYADDANASRLDPAQSSFNVWNANNPSPPLPSTQGHLPTPSTSYTRTISGNSVHSDAYSSGQLFSLPIHSSDLERIPLFGDVQFDMQPVAPPQLPQATFHENSPPQAGVYTAPSPEGSNSSDGLMGWPSNMFLPVEMQGMFNNMPDPASIHQWQAAQNAMIFQNAGVSTVPPASNPNFATMPAQDLSGTQFMGSGTQDHLDPSAFECVTSATLVDIPALII